MIILDFFLMGADGSRLLDDGRFALRVIGHGCLTLHLQIETFG